MTRWNDVLAAALVGAARASSAPGSGATPLDAALAKLPAEQPPEQRLLSEAGAMALWRHAGAEPLDAGHAAPAPAAEESAAPCPERATALLARLLRGDFGSDITYAYMLPEWLRLLAARGYALPPRWLPELLTQARHRSDLCLLVLPCLGERGRWLAKQNPDWRGLLAADDPAAWETADTHARLALLKDLRRSDPAQARALLESIWQQERAHERQVFLETFSEGLGPDDEAFLEAALDDRAKAVRAIAAELLACLPGSALVQRMQQRLSTRLALQPGKGGVHTLKITLPGPLDEATQRDGINDSPPRGTGKRVWRLIQMLAVVPPAFWAERWQCTPAEAILLADASGDPPGDDAAMLLSGWAWAAARHADAAWAEALMRRWGENDNFSLAQHLPALVALIPPAQMDAWLVERLRRFQEEVRDSNEIKSDLGLLDLLQAYDHPWSELLSRTLIETYRLLVTKKMRGPSALWRWSTTLPQFAHNVTPALITEFAAEWPDVPYWRSNVETFLSLVHVRREIAQAFGE